jgi:hypothetical protein
MVTVRIGTAGKLDGRTWGGRLTLGVGGEGGGSVHGRVSKTSSGREAFIKIISRPFF